MKKKLSVADYHYIETMRAVKSVEDIANDIDCKPSLVENYLESFRKAKDAQPIGADRGMAIMTEQAASIDQVTDKDGNISRKPQPNNVTLNPKYGKYIHNCNQ